MIAKVRVGTMGGNNLGFYGGIFSPDGNEVLAQGYDGGLHAWKNISDGVYSAVFITNRTQ